MRIYHGLFLVMQNSQAILKKPKPLRCVNYQINLVKYPYMQISGCIMDALEAHVAREGCS